MTEPELKSSVRDLSRDFRVSYPELWEKLAPLFADQYRQGMETCLEELSLGMSKGKLWQQARLTIRAKYGL